MLEAIAEKGADGFYKGEIARRLGADLHGQGNAMTLLDLARYYAPEREAVARHVSRLHARLRRTPR